MGKTYKYRLASSNWIFASHGISGKGFFYGNSRCYRSSVLVNGPVRWVHGNMNDCKVMNERTNITRCYFKSGQYNTKGKGFYAVYSKQQLVHDVSPYSAPLLNWDSISKYDPRSLFW